MTTQYDAIYARQSIDKKDSISTESQTDFCKHEVRGGEVKEYVDKGFSGKNTDRPNFQQLVKDIKAGKIKRVIVYKLDRISRSILDFAEMMAMFQEYGVEFVSCTEKFDTSTPVGRAMLSICIVFAQLERETIQGRVADAFYSRSLKGFRSGATPFGFHLIPFKLNGINAKMLEADEDKKSSILLMFQMYAEPNVSYGDVTRYFDENGILFDGEHLKRSTLKRILRNPSYTFADQNIYDFYKSQGTEIVNLPEEFIGVTSCYLHRKQEAKNTDTTLDNFRLVIAPHEGIVPSDLWLVCIKKLLGNRTYQPARKANRSWLAGKVKCGNCHRAFTISRSIRKNGTRDYYRCTLRLDNKNCCKGGGTLRVEDVEALVEDALKEKLKDFEILQKRKKNTPPNPKLLKIKTELEAVEEDIEQLVDSLTGAKAVLASYINEKIEALDIRRRMLNQQYSEMIVKLTPPEELIALSGYIEKWDSISFEDKRVVLDKMIDVIYATEEKIEIKWKI